MLCLISASATASDSHKWGAIAELSEVWANGRYLTPQIACSPNQWDLAFSQSSERIASGLANLEDGKRALMAASGAYVQSPAAYAYKPQSRGLVNKLAVDKDTSIIRVERELSPSERQQWHDAFTANRVVIDLRSSAGNGIQDIVERSAVYENRVFVKSCG